MSAHGAMQPKQFFHTTPHDLGGQTHVLPPDTTGREPHWEGMDEAERGKVFMTNNLPAAHGWAEDLHDNGKYHVYEVHPEGGTVQGGYDTFSAPKARIVRRVHP